MEACLKKVNSVIANQLHDAMLLCQTARPSISQRILQRFRFANALKRIGHDRLDQVKCSQSDFPFRLDSVSQILAKLRMKNGITLTRFAPRSWILTDQCPSPVAGWKLTPPCRGATEHASLPSSNAAHFWATEVSEPSPAAPTIPLRQRARHRPRHGG